MAVRMTASAPRPRAMYGSCPERVNSSTSEICPGGVARTPLALTEGVADGPCGVPPVSWYAQIVATCVDGLKVARYSTGLSSFETASAVIDSSGGRSEVKVWPALLVRHRPPAPDPPPSLAT